MTYYRNPPGLHGSVNRKWRKGTRIRRVYTKQGFKCCYCEKHMKLPKYGIKKCDSTATKEHLIRQVDGGKNNAQNLAVACGWCNSHRQSRNWLEWKSMCMGELDYPKSKTKQRKEDKCLNTRKQ